MKKEIRKVVVLGSLPIASMVCKVLMNREDTDIVAVVLCSYSQNDDPWDVEPLARFAMRNRIPVLSMKAVVEAYAEGELDCAFSCRFAKIIKNPFIKRFKVGVVNFHGGLLPEFGGLYSSCHTLSTGSKIGGGTLHYIEDETIDTGPVIDRGVFPVQLSDTSLSVFRKTQQALYDVFLKNIDGIMNGTVATVSQEQLLSEGHEKHYFDGKSLNNKIESESFDAIITKARSFDFRGHERAYIEKNGVKVYVTTIPPHVLERSEERVSSPLEKLQVSGVDVRCKRDDLYPAVGGGNKARKIQYILQYAVENGFNALVTNGGLQSNHARATALACAESGMHCSLVLHTECPDEVRHLVGNLMLMEMSGAELQYCKLRDLKEAMDQEMDRLRSEGYQPLYIWGGGHCIQGSIAYFEAAREAQRQCGDWVPDYIVHASGTGTTQAGLIAGYADLPTKIIGISVARESDRGVSVIEKSLSELGDYLKIDLSEQSVDFRDDWIEGGYEAISDRLLESVDQAARKGLILDPTYTGKAFLGMNELIQAGEIPRGSKVLFWHTGGLLNLLSSPAYLKKTV
jgi:1-aminocyclopropane-1-carboxylate deaminase/D-cysteine desulfhydrase-like pyridoxal-dependent ACC family enzyme/methionyl-tRNA formyltransferase